MSSVPNPSNQSLRFPFLNSKRAFFLLFGLMALLVIYVFEVPLMNPNSPAWAHFAPKSRLWLLPHALGGTLALLLAPFQFSNRLRQRNLQLHRVLGRIYVGAVMVAAPMAIPIAAIQGPPEVLMAAVMQSSGWLITTLVALYCVRTGNITQHRQWMIRSYPFGLVFLATRTLFLVPAIHRMGLLGIIEVVWSCVFAAAFIPTFVINWRAIFPVKKALAARAGA